MKKENLSIEQKRLDLDIWIIFFVTLGTFLIYAVIGNRLMNFVKNDSISVVPRLLLNAAFQFGVAGLGITIVCILRKEKFTDFGLRKENVLKAVIGTIICFVPYISYVLLSGEFRGYQPFNIIITNYVIASGSLFSIIGIVLIIVVWGFFEGFNYAVVCEKINRRYPLKNKWLDYGAITCAVFCILFHPIDISFWGIVEVITTFIAIYGMLIVRRETGNAWGCVFAFCFIWNAI